MEFEEAVDIVVKQIQDYDAWAYQIMECLVMRQDLCTHPYPVWFTNKEKGFENKCFCPICNQDVDEDKLDKTWKAFDKQSKVNEAIRIIVERAKAQTTKPAVSETN